MQYKGLVFMYIQIVSLKYRAARSKLRRFRLFVLEAFLYLLVSSQETLSNPPTKWFLSASFFFLFLFFAQTSIDYGNDWSITPVYYQFDMGALATIIIIMDRSANGEPSYLATIPSIPTITMQLRNSSMSGCVGSKKHQTLPEILIYRPSAR